MIDNRDYRLTANFCKVRIRDGEGFLSKITLAFDP